MWQMRSPLQIWDTMWETAEKIVTVHSVTSNKRYPCLIKMKMI